MHDVPRSPYWKKFKEAYTVLEAMRNETKRMADDGAASGRLEKVAKFAKRSLVIIGLLAAATLGAVGWTLARNDMEEKVFEFQLGKPLEATVKQTRLPLSGQNNWGMINVAWLV